MDDIVISCIRTVVVKTCSTAATLAWFTVERLLDLIGLVFNLLAICTIVRAYPTKLQYTLYFFIFHTPKITLLVKNTKVQCGTDVETETETERETDISDKLKLKRKNVES